MSFYRRGNSRFSLTESEGGSVAMETDEVNGGTVRILIVEQACSCDLLLHHRVMEQACSWMSRKTSAI